MYCSELVVPSYLVDNHVALSPVGLLGILQETAASHCGVFHLSGLDLKPKGFFWILSRMHIQIERLPLWSEKITIQTWERPHSFISQPREFQIIDPKGETIVRASSMWAIIDCNSKPQKLEQFDCEGRYPLDQEALTVKAFPRFTSAPLSEEAVLKTALHSDIDLNEHVNNTRYLQWAMDALGHDFWTKYAVTEINIHFISQIFPGNGYYVGIQHENKSVLFTIYAADDRREVCKIALGLSSFCCE